MDRLTLLFAFILLPAAAALAQPGTHDKSSSFIPQPQCSAAAAYGLLGEKLTPDTQAEAQARAGATSVRVIRQGGIRDLGLADLRLTVAVDGQRRIAELRCE